jgi:hypothetical protein
MKKDLRMNAKSPDPDDLAREELAESDVQEMEPHKRRAERFQIDRSAPHIPPLERGKISGE